MLRWRCCAVAVASLSPSCCREGCGCCCMLLLLLLLLLLLFDGFMCVCVLVVVVVVAGLWLIVVVVVMCYSMSTVGGGEFRVAAVVAKSVMSCECC